eukprot:m.88955 g.88955  ORF g.88955 m.88955 type:complete len:318 (-) comp18098_c3_seq1:57-1010(-)
MPHLVTSTRDGTFTKRLHFSWSWRSLDFCASSFASSSFCLDSTENLCTPVLSALSSLHAARCSNSMASWRVHSITASRIAVTEAWISWGKCSLAARRCKVKCIFTASAPGNWIVSNFFRASATSFSQTLFRRCPPSARQCTRNGLSGCPSSRQIPSMNFSARSESRSLQRKRRVTTNGLGGWASSAEAAEDFVKLGKPEQEEEAGTATLSVSLCCGLAGLACDGEARKGFGVLTSSAHVAGDFIGAKSRQAEAEAEAETAEPRARWRTARKSQDEKGPQKAILEQSGERKQSEASNSDCSRCEFIHRGTINRSSNNS